MTPGYKTSSFWFTLVSFIFSGLFLVGVIKDVDQKEELISVVTHAVESIILIGTQGFILYKYMKSRSEEKVELEKAKEDSRLRNMNYQLELGGVIGAQQAQADSVAAQQRAISQAAQGLGQLGGVLLKNEDINPLYARAKGFDLLPNSKTVVDKKAFQNQIQSPTTNTGLFSRQNVNPNFGTDSLADLIYLLFGDNYIDKIESDIIDSDNDLDEDPDELQETYEQPNIINTENKDT